MSVGGSTTSSPGVTFASAAAADITPSCCDAAIRRARNRAVTGKAFMLPPMSMVPTQHTRMAGRPLVRIHSRPHTTSAWAVCDLLQTLEPEMTNRAQISCSSRDSMLVGLMALGLFAEGVRTVAVVGLFAGGMAFGAGLMRLILQRRGLLREARNQLCWSLVIEEAYVYITTLTSFGRCLRHAAHGGLRRQRTWRAGCRRAAGRNARING